MPRRATFALGFTMRVAILTLLCSVLVSCATAELPTYFPKDSFPDDFVDNWYSTQLVALKERPLCCDVAAAPLTVRFTWLRSFHHPVMIRLDKSKSGRWIITTKISSGRGGYDPGHLTTEATVPIADNDAAWIAGRVKLGSDFWGLTTEESPAGPDGTVEVTLDGAQWIVEELDGTNYHVVDRVSPDDGLLRDIATHLMTLSHRSFGPVY